MKKIRIMYTDNQVQEINAEDGEFKAEYYDDILQWETDGYVDVKHEVLKWFGMEDTK